MCEMLEAVKCGKFLPLAPRDSVFSSEDNPMAVLDQMLKGLNCGLQELADGFLSNSFVH